MPRFSDEDLFRARHLPAPDPFASPPKRERRWPWWLLAVVVLLPIFFVPWRLLIAQLTPAQRPTAPVVAQAPLLPERRNVSGEIAPSETGERHPSTNWRQSPDTDARASAKAMYTQCAAWAGIPRDELTNALRAMALQRLARRVPGGMLKIGGERINLHSLTGFTEGLERARESPDILEAFAQEAIKHGGEHSDLQLMGFQHMLGLPTLQLTRKCFTWRQTLARRALLQLFERAHRQRTEGGCSTLG